jgi:hypothetical protein
LIAEFLIGKISMSNFAIYLVGIIFVAGGLAFAAYKMGISPIWIFSSVVVIIGLGIMAAVSKTRLKEKSDTDK